MNMTGKKSVFSPRFLMWNPDTGDRVEPLTEKDWERLTRKGYEWLYDIEEE